MKLDSLYVVVRDMGEARAFYGQLFERNPVLVDGRFSGFDLDGGLFGLLNAASFGEPVDSTELTYGNNCVGTIRVDDVDAEHARIVLLRPPEVTPIATAGSYRLFQVQDRDGNRVEFYEEGGAA